jgi:hypothetical protein
MNGGEQSGPKVIILLLFLQNKLEKIAICAQYFLKRKIIMTLQLNKIIFSLEKWSAVPKPG